MRPDVESFAEDLYAAMEPLAYADEENEWILLKYLGAIGIQFQEIDDYVRDGPNGEVGWSILVDLDRTPDKALPWLGQFVGVEVNTDLSPDDQRQQILDVAGWKRGTLGAIKGAARPWLTGNRTVIVHERDTSAYHFQVITYRQETPMNDWGVTNLLANPSFETNITGWVTM